MNLFRAFRDIITEILGVEVLYPKGTMLDPLADEFPENWYKEVG